MVQAHETAMITRQQLLHFIRDHSLTIQASVSADEAPQAALVGFIVTEDFEIFFDTSNTSRKVTNLRRNPRVAFVIGGLLNDERTVQ
jgi:general stress protein 26